MRNKLREGLRRKGPCALARVARPLWVAVAAVALAPQGVTAQTCDPEATKVTGSVTVGDGSTPITPSFLLGISRDGALYGSGRFPFGSATVPLGLPGSYTFSTAADGGYLGAPASPGATCFLDSHSCLRCSGTFSLQVYAYQGSFSGLVTQLPRGTLGPGAGVSAVEEMGRFQKGSLADANGHYQFHPTAGSFSTNNWGVFVFGDGGGPASGTYRLSTGAPEDGVMATTSSSQNVAVDLTVKTGGMEEPDIQPPCPPSPSPPPGPSTTGLPISLTTGNMYFRQNEVQIPGVGPGLELTRTYNSKNRGPQQYGVFGPGWFHTYEQRLTFPLSDVILLRLGNGVPAYFQDVDGDLIYEASVPFTKESRIVKAGIATATTYVRTFRVGGSEVYDHGGRLRQIVDASGNTVTLAYDALGRLSAITGAGTEASGDRALTLAYTGSSSRPDSLSGPAGLIASYGYNAPGTLTSVTYPDGSGYTFGYDSSTHQLLTVTDLEGKVLETHTYDATGRATTSELSGGQEKYTATYAPLLTSVTDALGNVTTYQYTNIWGMKYVTRITGPCSSCGGQGSQVQEWSYDRRGRVLSHRDGLGNTTTYAYDSAAGDLLAETDALGKTTTYTYDAQGRMLTGTLPDGALTSYTWGPAGPLTITEAVTSTTNRTTRIAYTPQGQPTLITDPRGQLKRLRYNPSGDLVSAADLPFPATTFAYDAMGRRTSVQDALRNKTTTEYDARGRVTKVTNPDLRSTAYAYDRGGRIARVTDPLKNITRYAYDPYGRLQAVTDPADGISTYGYDSMGNLTSITDARGKVTTFEYDAYSRVKKVTYPGGAFETFTYDAAGHLATKTDRKGVVSTYSYDAVGRLRGKSYSDRTPSVSYSYDDVGRLLTAANGDDVLEWSYDLVGQLVRESSQANGSTVAYAYDPNGNRLSVTLDGKVLVSYAYDTQNRLRTVTHGGHTFRFSYDAAGRRTALAFPNGLVAKEAYDKVSRLLSINLNKGNVLLNQSAYSYDGAGNRLTRTGLGSSHSYTYDHLYRLTMTGSSATPTQSYSYDALGNRISATGGPEWTYDDGNRLLSHGGASFSYDANGNLVEKVEAGKTWTYQWNGENQLTSVLWDGREVAQFGYDPLGRRIRKVAGGVAHTEVKYTYDGVDILRELDSDGVVYTYVHGPGIDEPLRRDDASGNAVYYHADGLGSIIKISDQAGNIVHNYQYDPWGNIEVGAEGAGYAFTGREWDTEIGLYYYRARYYDPKIGRFISEDPIGFEGGINFYAYVGNNPVNLADPLGLGAVPPTSVYDPRMMGSCPPGTPCIGPAPPPPPTRTACSRPCTPRFHWGIYFTCVGSKLTQGGTFAVFGACLGAGKQFGVAAGYVCSFAPIIAARVQCEKLAWFCDEQGPGEDPSFNKSSAGRPPNLPPPAPYVPPPGR